LFLNFIVCGTILYCCVRAIDSRRKGNVVDFYVRVSEQVEKKIRGACESSVEARML